MCIVAKHERVINLLAQGMSATQVLSITGMAPTYLKSLLENEEVQAAVQERSQGYLQEAEEDDIITNKYLAVENILLKKIQADAMNADFNQAVRALEVVSNRQEKRLARKNPQPIVSNLTINQVAITVPKHTMPEFTLNSDQEIVAINNKAMTPMTSEGVRSMFDAMKNNEKLVVSS